ncbi:MAG: DUF1489 domain-containing protein [Alphaproteobacteria bacterium]|nr:DUF1489 domain-containing protein [Alphaproteobacteria bacterium]
MSLHLLKLCVGVDEIQELRDWQDQRRAQQLAIGETPRLRHVTRNWPRRAEEVLEGGSLYWVIKGFIRVRQRIIGFDEVIDPVEGTRKCGLVLDPELVEPEFQPHRPMQGWRYLEPADAPADRRGGSAGGEPDLPPEMLAELRELGIL